MIAELLNTFETTVKFIEQSVVDLSEQQMLEQPTGVPNHGTWTLGYIIYSCQGTSAELGAEQWLPDDWESLLGYGSMHSSDFSVYPKKSEVLTLVADALSRLRHTPLATSESSLRQPLSDQTLPTMGDLLSQVVAAHTDFHTGQPAVWRRAIGKQSVAVFI